MSISLYQVSAPHMGVHKKQALGIGICSVTECVKAVDAFSDSN